MPAPAPVEDPSTARDTARRILDNPPYSDGEEHWYDPILEVLRDPFGALSRLIDWIAFQITVGASIPWIAWPLVIVLAVAVTLLVIRLTRSIRRDESAPIVFRGDTSRLSIADMTSRIAEAEQNENWKQVVRLRYSLLITRMGERGLVRVRAGKTIGEYQAEVESNAPSSSADFRRASSVFERIWYGDFEATRSDAEEIRRVDEQLRKVAA